jgi:hypothetical protein
MNRVQAESPRRCSLQRASVLSPGDQTDSARLPGAAGLGEAVSVSPYCQEMSPPDASCIFVSPCSPAAVPVLVRWTMEAFCG